MAKTRILAVDDEVNVLKFIRANLEDAGYDVITAINGADALAKVEKELPDMVMVDITMPIMDGFEVCRRLREWTNMPIIVLTARGDQTDILKAFNLGVDDYVIKPFGMRELQARVKAVLRRSEALGTATLGPTFASGSLIIDYANRNVTVSGNKVELTPTEYNLLQELTANTGKALTYSHLLSRVWGPEYQNEREYLHVFIGRLRAKLENDPSIEKHISTISGVGYQFE